MEVSAPFFGQDNSFLEKAGGHLRASLSFGGRLPQRAAATQGTRLTLPRGAQVNLIEGKALVLGLWVPARDSVIKATPEFPCGFRVLALPAPLKVTKGRAGN